MNGVRVLVHQSRSFRDRWKLFATIWSASVAVVDEMAPRWMTASSLRFSSQANRSAGKMKSASWRFPRFRHLQSLPSISLTATSLRPASFRPATTFEPMKPAPPVTKNIEAFALASGTRIFLYHSDTMRNTTAMARRRRPGYGRGAGRRTTEDEGRKVRRETSVIRLLSSVLRPSSSAPGNHELVRDRYRPIPRQAPACRRGYHAGPLRLWNGLAHLARGAGAGHQYGGARGGGRRCRQCGAEYRGAGCRQRHRRRGRTRRRGAMHPPAPGELSGDY